MIPARRNSPKRSIFYYLQFGAALLAFLVVALFLKFSLKSTAVAFRSDFERQSFLEMSRGETFLLARRLAALAKSSQISCAVATKGGIIFFEEKKGGCRSGFFRTVETVHERNQDIAVTFTLRLQDELLFGFFTFFILQTALVTGIWLAQKNLIFSMHVRDLELAALARQVGHDIRSPLAILSRPLADPELSKRALARMREMVGRLLGEQLVERSPHISLANLVSEAVEEKKIENLAESDISVGAALPSIRPEGGVFLWRRVISNLLNNSIEASLPGRPKIEIRITSNNDICCVEIRDHGRGIPAHVISRLGSKGFTFGKKSGRGLGLSSAFEFMNSIGGSVEIKSIEGRGTSVFLRFPQTVPEAVLIDDDSQLAIVWKMTAEKRGVRFHHYSHPKRFLEEMKGISRRADIYLDISFPDDAFNPESFGRRLKKAGFENIFLATGHSKDRFKAWKWVSGIVGKEPPWI